MKVKFDKGVLVRFVLRSGELGGRVRLTAGPKEARITGESAQPGMEHYLGEGFYHVTTMEGYNLIAHEDDLILEEDLTDPEGFTDPRTAAGMKGGLGGGEDSDPS